MALMKFLSKEDSEPTPQKTIIQDENILSIIIELNSIENKQTLTYQINKDHELATGKDHLFSYLDKSDIEQEFIKYGYLVKIQEHKELKKNSISELKLTLQKKIQSSIIKVDPKIINLSDQDLKTKLWNFFLAKQKIEGWMNGKILVVPEGVLNVIDRNLSSNIHAKLDDLTREEMLTLYTYRQQQKKIRTLINKKAKGQALERQPELTKRVEALLSNLKYKTKENQYTPLIAHGIEELPDLPDSSYRYYIFPIATYGNIKHALTKNNVYDSIYHNILFYEKNNEKLVIIIARTKEIADKYNNDLWTKQYGIYEVGKENRHIHDILKKEFYARFRVEDLCWTIRLIPNGKYHLKLIEKMKEFNLEVIEITPFTTEEKEAQKQEFLGDILARKRHSWRNIRLDHAEDNQQNYENILIDSPGNRGTKRQRTRKDRLIENMKDNLNMGVKHERKAFALQQRANYTKGSKKLFRDQKEAFISKYIREDDKIRYDKQICTVLRVFKRSLKIKLEYPINHFVHGKTSIIKIEKYSAWLPKEQLEDLSNSLHSEFSFMNLSNNEYETVRLIPNGSELTYYEAVILCFPTLINGLSKLRFEFLKENDDLIIIFKHKDKYDIINDNQAIQKLQEYEEQFNLTDIQTLIKQKEELVFSQKIPSFFPTPHNLITKKLDFSGYQNLDLVNEQILLQIVLFELKEAIYLINLHLRELQLHTKCHNTVHFLI